jgi:quercetin dioxygenase-like cupin family protein
VRALHKPLEMASEARPYTVANIEEILRTDLFHVRRFTLAPGDAIPWHHHPSTHDHYYILEGALTVELSDPTETVTLAAGQTYRIESPRPHHNSNLGTQTCVFLLIQGPGPSTFVARSSSSC